MRPILFESISQVLTTVARINKTMYDCDKIYNLDIFLAVIMVSLLHKHCL